MSLRTGIVGLPNVGKSTLFNALTNNDILVANYPFATIEPNVGVVVVPDERINKLSSLVNPEKTLPAVVQFTDIAGLVEGASQGEGLGNKFLSHIQEVDAIVHVVRCFEDENIIHVTNEVNPIRDIEIINLELILSDLEKIESKIERIKKRAQSVKDNKTLEEVKTLELAKENLHKNKSLRLVNFTQEQLLHLKDYNLLTLKPLIYLANINESELAKEDNEYVKQVKALANEEQTKAIKVSVKTEAELASLNKQEKTEFLSLLGIKTSGLDELINEAYDLLGLATFFTVGKIEVRAWTYRKGQTAPECAGIIHSDFQRGFIRAEVIKYEDMIEYQSEQKVKEAGKAHLEGKDYIMQDGDICHFRFNVTR